MGSTTDGDCGITRMPRPDVTILPARCTTGTARRGSARVTGSDEQCASARAALRRRRDTGIHGTRTAWPEGEGNDVGRGPGDGARRAGDGPAIRLRDARGVRADLGPHDL